MFNKQNIATGWEKTAGMLVLVLLSHFHLYSQIEFEDVTVNAGLIAPLKGMMGHGAAWGDVDGNGFPDLFIGSFTGRPDSVYARRGHPAWPEPDKLLLNNGDGTFTDVMDTPIRQWGRNSGAAFADFDNDGDLDLVVSHNAYDGPVEISKTGNYLFENDGTGIFSNVTKNSGLDFGLPFTGRNTFVLDYNGDGLLDIFMQEDWVRDNVSGGHSRLMKNTGDMVFMDATAEAGFPGGYREGYWGLGGWTGDINGDLWPDVFFAHSCRMFINNRDGTFHEKQYNMINPKYKAPGSDSGGYWTCGADIGDLDNDGDMDMVMGDHFPDAPGVVRKLYVFLNDGNDDNGDPVLLDITREAGLQALSGRSPHVQLQDIDNDGWVDIMTTNCDGFIYRNKGIEGSIPRFEQPVSSGFKGGIGYWAAGPLGDYDRDGKLDFIGLEWEPSVASPLLHNATPGAKNYIAVKLDLKDAPNRNGIGARVDIFKKGMLGMPEGHIATRIISVSNGYSSGYEAIAYFGLPYDKEVDILVNMPCDGPVYTTQSVKRNQLYILRK